MSSSTLHSNKDQEIQRSSGWPRLLLGLLAVALLAWLTGLLYTLHLNPEMRYYAGTYKLKRDWAEKLTREYGAKTVVYGGSSCKFGIDGIQLLEEYNLPCVNMGRGAGIGTVVLTMAAIEEVRPGDTLIVALEPGLITDGLDLTSQALQFSAVAKHSEWVRDPIKPAVGVSLAEFGLSLRPGGHHFFTMLGKLARGGDLYRYSVEEMNPSGFCHTPVRLPFVGPPRHGVLIPEQSKEFFRTLRNWCDANQVRIAYSLPWAYVDESQEEEFRKENLDFLKQMMDIMPVLKDEKLGAHSVREEFSDTFWHLDEKGAEKRTRSFGEQVSQWKVME